MNDRIAERVSRETERTPLFKSLIDRRMSLSILCLTTAVSEREVLQSVIVQGRNVSRLFCAYFPLR